MKVQLDSAAILGTFFPEIISNNVIEVDLGLENKIIQTNLSQKKCYDKKKNNERNSTADCILRRRLQEKNGFTFLRIKIMLNPQYNVAARKVQTTREERLVLIEAKNILNGIIYLFQRSAILSKLC